MTSIYVTKPRGNPLGWGRAWFTPVRTAHRDGPKRMELTECVSLIDQLPSEVILTHILTFLYPVEVWRCRRVSKRWDTLVVTYFKTLKVLDLNDDLSEYYVTEAGLSAMLKTVRLLRVASLSRCYRCVSGNSLRVLASCCHRLESLSLARCKKLTDDILRALAENCPRLRELELSYCFQVLSCEMTMLKLFQSVPLKPFVDLFSDIR